MRLSRRLLSVAAAAGLAASAAGFVATAAPAGAATTSVAFVSTANKQHDMANLGQGLNVRIADATTFSTVEKWKKIPAPVAGYYFFQNQYDGSYLTAATSFVSGGAVLTKAGNGSSAQMWKIHGPSYNAQLSNYKSGESRRLTYHAPGSQDPYLPSFSMDTQNGANQNFNIKNV